MGLALAWKPVGIESQKFLGVFKRDYLGRNSSGRQNIGHSGTLDPFAEGVLLIAWDEGTKLLAPLMGLPKIYQVRMILGATTSTLDTTSEFLGVSIQSKSAQQELQEKIEDQASLFFRNSIGDFEQIPPQFSAVHVDGKRAYEWARQGKSVELKPKSCSILSASHSKVEAVEREGHYLVEWSFVIEVSSGTYIRALARDWGQLFCGSSGTLSGLVRTHVGPWSLEGPTAKPSELGLLDLEAQFGIHRLTSEIEAQKLTQNGIFRALIPPTDRKTLILGPKDDLLAWTPLGSQTLGRVFVTNPLA